MQPKIKKTTRIICILLIFNMILSTTSILAFGNSGDEIIAPGVVGPDYTTSIPSPVVEPSPEESLEQLSHSNYSTPPNLNTASDWAHSGITQAYNHGIIPANLQTSFTANATRAEFAAFAVALYETVTGREITERATFNDTNDMNVQKMGGLGVVGGVGNGNFNPNGTITRQEAAVMLSRLIERIDQPLPIVAPTFADNAQIAGWATQAVGQIQAAGIMGGVGNNQFNPTGNFTREQSIITMLRLFDGFTGRVAWPNAGQDVTDDSTPIGTGTANIGVISSAQRAAGVSAGQLNFAVQSNGDLMAWGLRAGGQPILGRRDFTAFNLEGHIYNYPTFVLDNVIAVSHNYGSNSIRVIRNDGSLWSWGIGASFVGDGTTADAHEPVLIMRDVAYVHNAGHQTGRQTFVVRTDGRLYAWGENFGFGGSRGNNFSLLGDGTTTNRLYPVYIMSDVVSVTTGSNSTYVIRTDGSLWAWGRNDIGQLGDGTTINRSSPVHVMDNVSAVSAGAGHDNVFVVTTDGILYAWGSGFLGDGEHRFGFNNPIRQPIRIMENVVATYTGLGMTFAIREDNTLWAWGANGLQLGGITGQLLTPVQIKDDVMAVSVSPYDLRSALLVIRTDGSLWEWHNRYGTGRNFEQVMDSVLIPN